MEFKTAAGATVETFELPEPAPGNPAWTASHRCDGCRQTGRPGTPGRVAFWAQQHARTCQATPASH